MGKYTFDDLVKMGPFSAIDLIIDMSEEEKKSIVEAMVISKRLTEMLKKTIKKNEGDQ